MSTPLSEQLELDLDTVFLRLGATLDVEAKLFAATLAAEIEKMRIAGMGEAAIFQVLEQDALTGGRIFGAFENSVKSSIYGGIQAASAVGEQEVYKANGIDTDFEKWVTHSKRPCPDCDDRKGRTEPSAFWDAVGRPGDGATVCRKNCMCRLEPEELDTPDSVDISGLE